MKFKRFTKSANIRKIIGWIIYFYIVICYKTTRWTLINMSCDNQINHVNSPAIYAFWHGRLAMVPYLCPAERKMNVLISSHSDGDIIKNAVKYFKFTVINGSSKKNAFSALRVIINKLANNQNVAITPDGSRGPARVINSAIIEIAKMSKVPIIPVVYSTSSSIIINSWDSFMFPLPFAKAVLIYGESLYVPENSNLEEIQKLKSLLAFRLNYITDYADQLTNKKSRENI